MTRSERALIEFIILYAHICLLCCSIKMHCIQTEKYHYNLSVKLSTSEKKNCLPFRQKWWKGWQQIGRTGSPWRTVNAHTLLLLALPVLKCNVNQYCHVSKMHMFVCTGVQCCSAMQAVSFVFRNPVKTHNFNLSFGISTVHNA